jgi:predicted nucleic acid-binding protein
MGLMPGGLILDTCILIEAERKGGSIQDLLRQTKKSFGEVDIALSAVSVVELTYGIYRARTDADRVRRRNFADEVFNGLIVHSVSLAIAQVAGRIEGEQAAKGIAIPFEDLVIGATALHLGYDVVTLNTKHFRFIPDLKTVTI